MKAPQLPDTETPIQDVLESIAKALAALLVPYILMVLANMTEKTGIEVPFDPSWVETVILSVVTAIAVWWKRNRPLPPA
jgi:hypothetical protein